MAHNSALEWLDEPVDALLEIKSMLRRSGTASGAPAAAAPAIPPGMERVTRTTRIISERKLDDEFGR